MLKKTKRKMSIKTTIIAVTALSTIALTPLNLPVNMINNSSAIASAAAVSDSKAVIENFYNIVALGDSLTAGYEPGFTEESVNKVYGYVEHVYEQALFHGLRASYTNYGVIGLQTTGLKLWMEAAAQNISLEASAIQKNLPDPRADKMFADTKNLNTALKAADLVVLTIGGNDVTAVMSKLTADKQSTTSNEAAALLKSALDNYEEELEATLRITAKLQPNAQFVIANQYSPVPAPIKFGDSVTEFFKEDDRLYLVAGLTQLGERLNKVAQRLNKDGIKVTTVDVAKDFIGNEIPYTNISNKDRDIHPNKEGYAVMGKAFSNAIWGDYRTVKPRETGTNISVVVKGKELLTVNKPLLQEGRTFVALRDIVDATGAKLNWIAATKTASIVLKDRTVDITIGADTIKINGKAVKLNAPPAFLYSIGGTGKTYVPLAALSEGLNFQVEYREKIKTAFINE